MKQQEHLTRAQRVIRLSDNQIKQFNSSQILVVLLAIRATAKYIIGKSDTEPVAHFNEMSKIAK